MDKNVAQQFMQAFLELNNCLNSATELTFAVVEESKQKEIRKSLAEIINIIYVDLMRPIINDYPDLDPDI